MLSHRALLAVGMALALGTRTSAAQETFRRADIDSTGRLRVVLSSKLAILPPKDTGQVAFQQVRMSSDRRTVGWVALYENCCTSYPIPLELVLLGADGDRTMIGNGLPIWQWAFAADGRSVAIRQAPVHGAALTSYERRDIRTGRLMAAAMTDSSTPPATLPDWARSVMPRREPLPLH